jgi:hypothetical protein
MATGSHLTYAPPERNRSRHEAHCPPRPCAQPFGPVSRREVHGFEPHRLSVVFQRPRCGDSPIVCRVHQARATSPQSPGGRGRAYRHDCSWSLNSQPMRGVGAPRAARRTSSTAPRAIRPSHAVEVTCEIEQGARPRRPARPPSTPCSPPSPTATQPPPASPPATSPPHPSSAGTSPSHENGHVRALSCRPETPSPSQARGLLLCQAHERMGPRCFSPHF